MSYITKDCLFCQQPFEADKREHNRGKAKYCSLSHAMKDIATKRSAKIEPNVQCAYCDKWFYKNKSHQMNSKSGLFFCCRIHKDAAQRIGGIVEIMPPHYGTGNGVHDYRLRALAYYPNKCNRCSYDRFVEALMVHHVDHTRSNNELSNLEVLCPTCHWEHHLGLK